MSRKIVIIPSFASSHFLKCWIPNVIESINPDVIIINEGLFPNGPENKGHIDQAFREKWCYNGTLLGFDINDTEFIISEYRRKYPQVTIWLQKNGYGLDDANECFILSITRCDITEFRKGDIIFPLEPDAFHREVDSKKIQDAIDRLEIGQGIRTKWVDFLETQYYTEAINLVQPKYRRFAYRFDNMQNYKAAMSGFMSQDYSRLQKCDDFITYHYPWFVYDKWKELRYELIYRSDPQYWKDFESGLNEIRFESKYWEKCRQELRPGTILTDKIIIRPSRSDEGRYAKFIDVEHPEAIKNHPNFVK